MSDHLPIRSIHLEPNHSHNVDDAMPAPRARGLLSEPKDPKTTSRMRVGPLARSESDEDAPSKESSPGIRQLASHDSTPDSKGYFDDIDGDY